MLLAGWTVLASGAAAAAPAVAWRLTATYPHASGAFTQGLLLNDGAVVESSGQYGRSFVSRWYLNSGREQVRHELPRRYFAEGIAYLDGKIYLLSWRRQRAFVLDAGELKPVRTFSYRGEGWGLTAIASELLMSDGTARLRLIDPATFATLRTITVHDDGEPVDQLNELEWIPPSSATTAAPAGRLLANRWQTDTVLVIDPVDGEVTGELDLSSLYPRHRRARQADVLNGIAFDATDGTLLVTGKYWPTVYRLALDEPLP